MLLIFMTEINRDNHRSELPEEVPNVHGHEKEVDDIVQALCGEKKTTAAGVLVSGIAGIGKSTVAIQAGHRLKNEFETIVRFCSLRGANKGGGEDDDVLREISNVCVPGHQQSSEYPKHVLLNWCRRLEHELVLIVDNAEDAIDDRGDYPFLNLLSDMRKCSECQIKFVITSRRSEIETVGTVSNIQLVKIPVGPLDVREGIEVLKDSANLPFETAPDIEVKLHKIAELCENIPLALRLAGPLLAEESEYSFDGLIQELEGNPTKTLDLEHMMEIAFEKLDESLQHALVCLSVFPRSFARDAAEALLGKVNCAQHLTKLKKRCWIQKQGNRYLIHLLIRGYARQIGEREEFRQILVLGQQRFTEHFLTQILKNTDKYWGKDTCKESFCLFNEERINLEATLRVVGQQKIRNCGACKELEALVMQCQQVAQYIEYCVPFKIYYDFLVGLLHFSRVQEKINKEVEILCLLFHESRKHGKGDVQKSKDLIGEAIKLHNDNLPCFDEEGLSEVFYLIHYGRYLSQDCNEREKSHPFLEKAISIYEKDAAKHLEHNFTFDKGKILSQMGHNAKLHKDGVKREAAVRYYSEALNFRLARYGKHLLTAFSYKEMGDYFLYIEELDKADENYKKALAILENMDVKEQKEIVPIYKNFGICYQKRKDFVRSREIFQLGRSVADNTIEGNHKWKVWINTYLALLLYKEYPDEEGEAGIISAEVFQMGKELGMKKWPEKEALETFYKNQ